MSILHLAIATSGLPGATKSVWAPRMAAALVDDAGNVTDRFAVSVRADGRVIEASATLRHGITTKIANQTGIDELSVIASICGLKARGKRLDDRPGLINCARVMVAWNVDFVTEVLTKLFIRHGENAPGMAWMRPGMQKPICLQEHARLWCKLPAVEGDDGQYRRPTRDEAASALCGLPARPLPHTVDDDLELQRVHLWPALRQRKAFEMEAVA